MKKEKKWDVFKEGASSPKTLITANMYFTVGMFCGASLATYTLFSAKSWGFGIFMLFLSLMQVTAFITNRKQYKVITQAEKNIDENQQDLLEALKEA